MNDLPDVVDSQRQMNPLQRCTVSVWSFDQPHQPLRCTIVNAQAPRHVSLTALIAQGQGYELELVQLYKSAATSQRDYFHHHTAAVVLLSVVPDAVVAAGAAPAVSRWWNRYP